MRNTMMIVATLCGFAAAFSPRPALAIPTDAGASATVASPDHTNWICGVVDGLGRVHIQVAEEEKSETARQFLITGEMKERADITGDDLISIDDLVMLLAAWGNCPVWSELTCQGDLNGDNVVDFNDLSIMLTLLDMAIIPVIELPVENVKIVIQAG